MGLGLEITKNTFGDTDSEDDADEHENETPSKEYCREVKDICIQNCAISDLPSGDNGFRFWNCVNECLDEYGCLGI